jgi:hypothetical protein
MERKPIDLVAWSKREQVRFREERAQAQRDPTPPTPGPIQRFLEKNPDLLAWERTLDRLAGLTHVQTWITTDPGMVRRMGILADRCRTHATQSQHADYVSARALYLQTLGELVELFYLQYPDWDVKTLVHTTFGTTRIYLAISESALKEHVPVLPADSIYLLVREIPVWITASPEERADLVTVKSVFPEATLGST